MVAADRVIHLVVPVEREQGRQPYFFFLPFFLSFFFFFTMVRTPSRRPDRVVGSLRRVGGDAVAGESTIR